MNISTKLGNYFVDFNYRRDRTNCKCDYICRCATIENVSFDSISEYTLEDTLSHIKDNYSLIDAYCVERLIKLLLLENENLFNANISGGYYGEEVRGWNHDNLGELDNKTNEILSLNNKIDKILAILDFEYGYIPEHIQNCNSLEVETKYIKDIKSHNFNGMIKSYKYSFPIMSEIIPIGIINPNLDLIDGNHRLMNCKSNKAQFIILM